MSRYIFLPSCSPNSNHDHDNSILHFHTQLSRPIECQGEWEIALINFYYPKLKKITSLFFYIYSDIVEHTHVGGKKFAILRPVQLKNTSSLYSSNVDNYQTPYYMRVNKSRIDSIEIQLSPDLELPPDFYDLEHGDILLKLHLRKCNNSISIGREMTFILPSDERSPYSQYNTNSNFMIRYNPPIEFDKEIEICATEIDYEGIKKDIPLVTLRFICMMLCGPNSDLGRENGVYNNRNEDNPYQLQRSTMYPLEYSISVALSTKGIKNMKKRLYEKYSFVKDHLSIDFKLTFMRIITKYFEVAGMQFTDLWHIFIPFWDSNWDQVFRYQPTRLQNWEWFTSLEVDNHSHRSNKLEMDELKTELATDCGTHFVHLHGDTHTFILTDKDDDYNVSERRRWLSKSEVDTGITTDNETIGYLPSLYKNYDSYNTDCSTNNYAIKPYTAMQARDYASRGPVSELYLLQPRRIYLRRKSWEKNDCSDRFYVNINIIEPSLFGNTEKRILDVIPYSSDVEDSKNQYYEFTPQCYIKGSTKKIQFIHIEIKNDLGTYVVFKSRVRLSITIREIDG